jgi:hypothetical protein
MQSVLLAVISAAEDSELALIKKKKQLPPNLFNLTAALARRA